MSTGPLRQIQILRAQAGERLYSGQYGYDDLPRLQDCVFGPEVRVKVELELTRDHRGQRMAHAHIDLRLELQCQRCLEGLHWSDQLNTTMLLVSDESPEPESEDRDTICLQDGVLDVAALVEDEILLAMPLAPRHNDDSSCGLAWKNQQAQRVKAAGPFAALSALKDDTLKTGN